jgi:hypothetical protein
MVKQQRIRDPVHGLITFGGSDPFEVVAWRLLNTAEFQRLRRIKQLGFSELVYPGATHTRFAHCVGVFHTARQLVSVLERLLGSAFDRERARVAVCAALLHDLGHGPFSHTFEGVEKSNGRKKKHEQWATEIITGGTETSEVVRSYSADVSNSVAALLAQEYPSDIYSSVVSSQFDADRVDYLRRDKLMTGTEHGGFDWPWLFNNLEIERITIGEDGDQDCFEIDGLILGSKALKAAEGYLLGRFHLYTQVYMHKTTRGAEKLLGALLSRLSTLCLEGSDISNLPSNHPLREYYSTDVPDLGKYLELDDTVVWGSLGLLKDAKDAPLSELASRLRSRRLYKCMDIGARVQAASGDSGARFRRLLNEASNGGEFGEFDVLEDRASVSPYKFRDYESPDALSKVTIRRSDGTGRHEDVANVSAVVAALKEEKVFRVYARTEKVMQKLESIWEEARK